MKKSRPRPRRGKPSGLRARTGQPTGKAPSDARHIALEILCDAERGASVERALEERLTDSVLEGRDRALVTHLVQGTVRLHRYLDWALKSHASRPLDELSAPARNTLRLAAYQLVYLDRIPARAVVHEHVALASIFEHRGTAGFVNAVLRSFLRAGKQVPRVPDDDPVVRIGIETSHPDWMIRRWLDRFGEQETRDLAMANNRVPALSIRVNPLKSTPDAVGERMRRSNIEASAGRVNPGVFRLSHQPPRVRDLPGFEEGWFQIQDESSSLVGLLAAPAPGNRVIDLCSGLGGKATHLAELMEDSGTISALDRARWRLLKLRENCRRLGIHSVLPARADVTVPCVQPADLVLLDAPCSGTGVLARRADARWRRSEADIPRLADLQETMLRAASTLVKDGGCLVYSVCSLEPEEREGVVRRFLASSGGFEVQNAGAWLPGLVVDDDGSLQTFPHRHEMDGMFAARMRKVGPGSR